MAKRSADGTTTTKRKTPPKKLEDLSEEDQATSKLAYLLDKIKFHLDDTDSDVRKMTEDVNQGDTSSVRKQLRRRERQLAEIDTYKRRYLGPAEEVGLEVIPKTTFERDAELEADGDGDDDDSKAAKMRKKLERIHGNHEDDIYVGILNPFQGRQLEDLSDEYEVKTNVRRVLTDTFTEHELHAQVVSLFPSKRDSNSADVVDGRLPIPSVENSPRIVAERTELQREITLKRLSHGCVVVGIDSTVDDTTLKEYKRTLKDQLHGWHPPQSSVRNCPRILPVEIFSPAYFLITVWRCKMTKKLEYRAEPITADTRALRDTGGVFFEVFMLEQPKLKRSVIGGVGSVWEFQSPLSTLMQKRFQINVERKAHNTATTEASMPLYEEHLDLEIAKLMSDHENRINPTSKNNIKSLQEIQAEGVNANARVNRANITAYYADDGYTEDDGSHVDGCNPTLQLKTGDGRISTELMQVLVEHFARRLVEMNTGGYTGSTTSNSQNYLLQPTAKHLHSKMPRTEVGRSSRTDMQNITRIPFKDTAYFDVVCAETPRAEDTSVHWMQQSEFASASAPLSQQYAYQRMKIRLPPGVEMSQVKAATYSGDLMQWEDFYSNCVKAVLCIPDASSSSSSTAAGPTMMMEGEELLESEGDKRYGHFCNELRNDVAKVFTWMHREIMQPLSLMSLTQIFDKVRALAGRGYDAILESLQRYEKEISRAPGHRNTFDAGSKQENKKKPEFAKEELRPPKAVPKTHMASKKELYQAALHVLPISFDLYSKLTQLLFRISIAVRTETELVVTYKDRKPTKEETQKEEDTEKDEYHQKMREIRMERMADGTDPMPPGVGRFKNRNK